MGHEEADETQIGKSEAQIGSDNRLERPTDSPKISDLEPAPVSRPERDDDYEHGPVAQLEWQHFIPVINPKLPRDDDVSGVIN